MFGWIYKLAGDFFGRTATQEQKARIERICGDYEQLIDQYRKVQERTSGLSHKERKMIEARVAYLVAKGHLTVNKI